MVFQRRPPPVRPPLGMPLGGAIERSEPLAALLGRLAESRARFDAIAGVLPPALRQAVHPGPLDAETWVLLAAHGAAAAKLRQLLPRIEMVLRARGWTPLALKVHVQASSAVSGP